MNNFYPKWNKSEKLVCPHLRINEVYSKSDCDLSRDWIAKDKDPCPLCNRSNCHNHGKPFHAPLRLIVEKPLCEVKR